MENVNIVKGGLRQTVSILAFERQYKPKGWMIDKTEIELDETQETVKLLKKESEQLAYLRMKRKAVKKFNDGLFKSEEG